MKTPEEKYNEMCESAAQFLRDKKLTEAFEAAKIAFETAMYTAQFASPEERPKWMYRAEKALEIAEGIDEKIKSGQKTGTQQQSVKDGSKDVDLALPSRPKERFADVSGMQEAKDVVRMQVITPIKKPEIAQKYGLQSGGGLLLYGLPGTGKTFFAKAVAGELGLPFYVIKSSDILSKYLGESEKIFQNIFDTARKNPMSVIFIDETNGLLPSRNSESVHEVSKRIADIFLQETDGIDSKEKNPFLLIGATNFPNNIADAALDRFSTCIEVELPDASTRKFILQRELGKMEINIAEASVDFLVEQTQNFSCRALVNLGTYYRNTAAKNEIAKFSLEFCKENFRDTHIVSTNVIENIKDFKTRLGQNAIAEKKKSVSKNNQGSADQNTQGSAGPQVVLFDDVKGLDEAKEIVKRALINPIRYPDVYKTLKLIPGSGLLLYGPPGTGKTMFARAIANELKCKFYSVALEDIKGKTPLQTSEKISMLFKTARSNASGSVLFIDDCEEILSRPGNAKAYGVSQFLNELDGLKVAGNSNNVFVLIATNRPWMIDGALLRSGRISASAYIALPEFEVRREIITSALQDIAIADDVDIALLAEYTDGYSAAEIYHSSNGGGICNLARDYAADRWVKRIEKDASTRNITECVTMADFEKAISKIVPCAIKERERIAQNEAFYSTFTCNSLDNVKGFACQTRGGNKFSFSVPDVTLLKNFVFNSSAIQTVPDYKHFADIVFFYLNETDSNCNKFNAYATSVGLLKKEYNIKDLEKESDLTRPAILLHDGLNMAYTVVAAAYMAYSDNMVLTEPEKLREVLCEMNRQLYSKKGNFGKKQLESLIKKFNLFPENRKKLENIKTLASSMVAFVIAHELGHIVHGDIFNGISEGVYSRNMERSADQFAADTLNGLENPAIREFMFLGAALSFVADASLGNADITISVEDAQSHPATLERFNNLLKNAPPTLERFNLTENIFLACIP